jgi:uracil-DNA glycosylase family 4
LTLRRSILACTRCPRLIAHCRKIQRKKRRAYRHEAYWGRPVPSFGVRSPRLLVVGLAPGAHGANRTGRVFTGDASGDWLYRALFRYGFANQPQSRHRRDGLRLIDTAVNCAVRCAPPANRPSREELSNCLPFLEQEIASYRRLRVVVALGRIAFDSFRKAWGGSFDPAPRFVHDGVFRSGHLTLLSSYHPSRQNTQTGRLTRPMFHRVFSRARRILADAKRT